MHRRRWTRDDDLETTLPRDEFTCRSSALAFGKRILSMVVGKALCRLFQLPHLSHGEHASGVVVAVLATAGEERRGH